MGRGRRWRAMAGALAVAVAMATVTAACGQPSPRAASGDDPSTPSTTLAHPSAAPAPPSPDPQPAATPRLLVGAHYYLWFPENLGGGTLGQHLEPRRGPDRGYRSDDPVAAERAIDAASAAGIDFFTLDWWPSRPGQNANIDNGFLRARNLSAMQFAVFYETQDLGMDAYGVTALTPARRKKLVADMTSIADRYFSQPGYLRVNGRPVVFWYLTRTLTGDVAGAVADVRAALRARGSDVFLVGDEVFWSVVAPNGAHTTRPQVQRARLFDAITAYNLYDGGIRSHAGYPSTSSFVADSARLFATYKAAVGPQVPVLPSVIPGYNDRGTRPKDGHYAIPRQWRPGDDNGSTLRHLLTDVAAPALDPSLPITLITSWNEWNEDTAIEPMPSAAATAKDDSPSGRAFTQGYVYGGPGTPELDAVRDFTRARRSASPPARQPH